MLLNSPRRVFDCHQRLCYGFLYQIDECLNIRKRIMKALMPADAITSRMSVRVFTKQGISKELILRLLNIAARTPSGTNTQPWKVYVLEGKSLSE